MMIENEVEGYPPTDDIVNEIFDMAGCPDRCRINVKRKTVLIVGLVECGVGGTVTSIMADFRAMRAYDTRDGGGQLN